MATGTLGLLLLSLSEELLEGATCWWVGLLWVQLPLTQGVPRGP